MRDARVAGDGLDHGRQPSRVALQHAPLDAAVLVPELDLEVMHLLAQAHEAKRPGLDHPRVNRADGDLVRLLALERVERMPVHRRLLFALVADGLEPRVPRKAKSRLLVQLTLEAVQRRQRRGELVVAALGRGVGAGDLERARRCAKCARDRHPVFAPRSIQREDPAPLVVSAQDVGAPGVDLEHGHGIDGDAVNQDRGAHAPPMEAATCKMS